jgi:hypothetical protein
MNMSIVNFRFICIKYRKYINTLRKDMGFMDEFKKRLKFYKMYPDE